MVDFSQIMEHNTFVDKNIVQDQSFETIIRVRNSYFVNLLIDFGEGKPPVFKTIPNFSNSSENYSIIYR